MSETREVLIHLNISVPAGADPEEWAQAYIIAHNIHEEDVALVDPQ